MLLGGVDQRLVQVHHQDQFLVPVESLLVFSAELLCLLLTKKWFKSVIVALMESHNFQISNVEYDFGDKL